MGKRFKSVVTNINQLFSLRFFQIVWPLSFIVILLTTLLPAWQLLPWIQDTAGIPLHYNIHFGVDLFGAWWRVFTFPALGLGIWIANLITAIALIKKEIVLSYFFAAGTLFVEIFLFISMVFIVLLNLTYA